MVGTCASGTKQTESHLVFSVRLGFYSFPFPIIGESEVSVCCFGHKIAVVRIFCMMGLMMSLLKVKYYYFNFLRLAQVFRIYLQKLYIQL